MKSIRHALVVLCLLQAESILAQSPSRTVQVPRGGAVVIDGRVDNLEWRNSIRIEHPAGTFVRLQQDSLYLYVGITSERPGFASLCIAVNGDVHVLHASAALGAIAYKRNGDAWQSADTAFRYGMRNVADDEEARGERNAYLKEHGWVASTVRMSDGTSQEMQIAFDRFPAPSNIAVGRWLLSNGLETWPASIDAADGCVAQRLVTGYVPQGLRFDFTKWVRIER
jgi:hypothetical protein